MCDIKSALGPSQTPNSKHFYFGLGSLLIQTNLKQSSSWRWTLTPRTHRCPSHSSSRRSPNRPSCETIRAQRCRSRALNNRLVAFINLKAKERKEKRNNSYQRSSVFTCLKYRILKIRNKDNSAFKARRACPSLHPHLFSVQPFFFESSLVFYCICRSYFQADKAASLRKTSCRNLMRKTVLSRCPSPIAT